MNAFSIFVALTFLSHGYCFHLKSTVSRLQRFYPRRCPAGVKCIGVATAYFGVWNYLPKSWITGETEKKCMAISDNLQAHALMFHGPDIMSRSAYHLKRPSKQRWVFFSMQPPNLLTSRHLKHSSVMEDQDWRWNFNFTASYHRKSTIFIPFFQYIKNTDFQESIDDLELQRSEKSQRKLLYIRYDKCTINAYGRKYASDLYRILGNKRVTVADSCGKTSISEIPDDLFRQYFFFLSIEDSICDHYTIQRFWGIALASEMVPVIVEGLHGKRFLDEGPSFMYHVQIKSDTAIRDVAQQLQDLSLNEVDYSSFFEWKIKYDIKLTTPLNYFLRSLCEELYKNRSYPPMDLNTILNIKHCTFSISSTETSKASSTEEQSAQQIPDYPESNESVKYKSDGETTTDKDKKPHVRPNDVDSANSETEAQSSQKTESYRFMDEKVNYLLDHHQNLGNKLNILDEKMKTFLKNTDGKTERELKNQMKEIEDKMTKFLGNNIQEFKSSASKAQESLESVNNRLQSLDGKSGYLHLSIKNLEKDVEQIQNEILLLKRRQKTLAQRVGKINSNMLPSSVMVRRIRRIFNKSPLTTFEEVIWLCFLLLSSIAITLFCMKVVSFRC